MNKVNDYFFILSGGGSPFHFFHPKLSTMEISQYKNTAAPSTILLCKQLKEAHTPTPIIRQVVTNESGQHFGRSFYTNRTSTHILDDIESGGTSHDKLMTYLQSNDGIKFVALYDDLSRDNLHTIRRRNISEPKPPAIHHFIRHFDGTTQHEPVTYEE